MGKLQGTAVHRSVGTQGCCLSRRPTPPTGRQYCRSAHVPSLHQQRIPPHRLRHMRFTLHGVRCTRSRTRAFAQPRAA